MTTRDAPPPEALPLIGQRCRVQGASGTPWNKEFIGTVMDYDASGEFKWIRVVHPIYPGYPTFPWDQVQLLEI